MEEKAVKKYKIPKREQEALTRDGKIFFQVVEPFLAEQARNLAVWTYTITKLLERDFDCETSFASRLYPELEELNIANLGNCLESFWRILKRVRGKEFFEEYQQAYAVLQESERQSAIAPKKEYPQYVVAAAKWWRQMNKAGFSKKEAELFENCLRRKINEQILQTNVSLITVIETRDGKKRKISTQLGGYEKKAVYTQYLAMIASEEEVKVQEGARSAWKVIWKKEKS